MNSLATSNIRLLPSKGNEEEWIMDPRPVSTSPGLLVQYKCRYGSSLKIITQGEVLIAEEFSSSNPNKDWKKYQKRGKELLYCIIEDMSSDEVVCAARAIIDFTGVGNAKTNKNTKTSKCDRKRIILDYIHTVEQCRGQGLAAEVVRFLQRIAKGEETDFYVLAIEESQGYFLAKFGMILEQDSYLREEYNCFSDTFLLKCPDNVTGSKDTKLHESFISTDDGEENSWTSVDEETTADDDDLQEALQASLQIGQNIANEQMTEEQQLLYAMRLSLNGEVHIPAIIDTNTSKNMKVGNSIERDNSSREHQVNVEETSSLLSEEQIPKSNKSDKFANQDD